MVACAWKREESLVFFALVTQIKLKEAAEGIREHKLNTPVGYNIYSLGNYAETFIQIKASLTVF
jgi:hypothetical protein